MKGQQTLVSSQIAAAIIGSLGALGGPADIARDLTALQNWHDFIREQPHAAFSFIPWHASKTFKTITHKP